MSIENKAKPKCGHPKYSDQFWYVDRKFFDRTWWDDINTQAASTIHDIKDLDSILLSELYGFVYTDSDYCASDSGHSDSSSDDGSV